MTTTMENASEKALVTTTMEKASVKALAVKKKVSAEAKTNPLSFSWLVSALVSVIVPFLIYWICRARNYEWDGYHDDEQALGALIFVYLWSLVSFAVFVYFGFLHIRNGEEGTTFFLVMLAVFGNASFIACLLALCSMRALDGHNWDGRLFSLFPSLLVVTYAFWTFLSAAFAGGLLFKKYHDLKKQQKETAANGDDVYQRQLDDGAPPMNVTPSGNLA